MNGSLLDASALLPSFSSRLAAAARATIERRLAHGGGHTGWSNAWIACLYARFKDAELAKGILKNTTKSAAEPILKILNEAIANAENNFQMDKEKLFVAECYATPGTTLKRIQPRAQGRAYHILKRTSHVTLVVKEKEVG